MSKQDKVKVTNLKKLPEIEILQFYNPTLHARHSLKLFNKMFQYEMDPTRTADATEQTRDAGQMDRRPDRQTDRRSETIITPNNFAVQGV